MKKRIRPHREAEPRSFARFEREVAALLIGRGMSPRQAGDALKKWKTYVRARWKMGRPPCMVSDHVARWSKERIVCPCGKRACGGRHPKRRVAPKRRAMPKKRGARRGNLKWISASKVARSRRGGRDADNPRVGEVFESRAGLRWQIVKVSDDKKKVQVRFIGGKHTDQAPFTWGSSVLRSMKETGASILSGGMSAGDKPREPSFFDKLLGGEPPKNDRDPERRRRRRRK